jgi:hypothetical protein
MLRAALILILLGSGAQQAPLPTIQNGRVETRQAASLEREIAAAKSASTEPVWVAWRVPIADGQRGNCSTYKRLPHCAATTWRNSSNGAAGTPAGRSLLRRRRAGDAGPAARRPRRSGLRRW